MGSSLDTEEEYPQTEVACSPGGFSVGLAGSERRVDIIAQGHTDAVCRFLDKLYEPFARPLTLNVADGMEKSRKFTFQLEVKYTYREID